MASPQEPWVPLSLSKIERKPKTIEKVDGFYIGVQLTERQINDFALINSLIKTGGDLSLFYRRSQDRAADKLLHTHHVMHLHLGGPGSNALLYLVQFSKHVLLLCIDTHVHLDDIPPGKKLSAYGISRFARTIRERTEQRTGVLSVSLEKLKRPKDKG